MEKETFFLLDYYYKGGFTMHLLLACSIIGLAFIIERFIFYFKTRINAPKFLSEFFPLIKKKDIPNAIKLCERNHAPLTNILREGLLQYEQGKDAVARAMERQATVEVYRIERGLSVLAAIANVAPLLGFLGTVTGMIKSFGVIAVKGLDEPALVALGISEALITTATGLLIAIPVVAFWNYFIMKVNRLTKEIEQSTSNLLEML